MPTSWDQPSFGIPGNTLSWVPGNFKDSWIYKALSCLSASGQTDAVIVRLTNAIWRKEGWGVRKRDVCLCAPRVLTTVFQCQVLSFTLLRHAEMGVEWGWGWTTAHPRGASSLFPKPVFFQTQAQCLWKCKVLSLFSLTKALQVSLKKWKGNSRQVLYH